MKKFLLSVLFVVGAVSVSGTDVTYTADNVTVFPNPERGYTVQADEIVTEANPRVLTVSDSWFSGGEKDNIRLLLYLSYLNNFKSQDLPDAILDAFDEDMAQLRRNGWKCVLRFAYANSDNNDATLSWIQRHLEQLRPHLAANADVIYVMEAGFVGEYGEWYYSANFGNATQHMNADRNAVVDALLENAPSDRFILLRTPMAKTEYLAAKGISTAAVTSAEAFTSAIKARLGHHNDAFLADYGNAGTYASNAHSDDPDVRAYIAAETQYVPNGGETNVTDEDKAEELYEDAPSEMGTYHWSFCGNSYAEAVTSRWRSGGQYETQNVYMGYRYNLIDGTYPSEGLAGEDISVTIILTNVGYAPMYNDRPVYLVLKKDNGTKYSLRLSTDPRRWSPGETVTIDETVTLPSDMYDGTYRLYLHLPDKYASIADEPRYAVRLANVGVWEATSGMNDLGADITITGAEVSEQGIADGENKLSAAITSADDGDVILLEGTYTETAEFTISKNITIKAVKGEEAIIKPAKQIKIADNVTVRFEGVKFDASELQTGDYSVIRSSGTTGGNSLILEGCEVFGFANTSAVIACRSSYRLDYLVVNNCQFYNNTRSCIFLENTNTLTAVVTNSSFYNISLGEGGFSAGIVDVRTASGKVIVDHCTFYNCPTYSTDYGCVGKIVTSNAEVYNNICVMPSTFSTGRAIRTDAGSHVKNCLTYNYTSDYKGVRGGGSATGCLFDTDPLFADASACDFHLQTTSPCLNAATDGSHLGDPRWWPEGSTISITPAHAISTYVATGNLDFSDISGLKAYVATSANASEVTMREVGAVPTGTPLVLIGTAGTTYNIPVAASASAPAINLLRAGDGYTTFPGSTNDYLIYTDGKFHPISGGTIARGKAYLHLDSAPAGSPELRIVFEEQNATELVNAAELVMVAKFIKNGQLYIQREGVTYDTMGRVVR